MSRLAKSSRLVGLAKMVYYKRFIDDFPCYAMTNIWLDTQDRLKKAYVVETVPKVIERCILMTTDPGDLVLDPTCGSGTMAYVAEQSGRRWITIDTSRVALALARSRVMGARYPYYLLADSPAGREKEAGLTQTVPSDSPTGRRHPTGVRVRARASHHPEGDRQQRGDRRDLGAVAEDAGAAAGGTERRARPNVGGVGDPAGGRRSLA